MRHSAAQAELEQELNIQLIDTKTNAGDPAPGVDDRRSSHRFSLQLAVKCRRVELPVAFGRTITGESVNISSKGLLFATTEALLPGQVVEALIEWPVLLDDQVRLTLVVEGRVVRKVGNHAAMRIERYKFRTRSAREAR